MEDTVRRSNQLVLAGVAFFVVGVIIVLLLARDDGSNSALSSSDTTPVLVAKESIPSGTKGEDAIAKVEVKQVKIAEKQPDALSAPSQLSSQRFAATFSDGEQIRQGGLQTRLATVDLPEGKQAVAVSFKNVPGGAGYVQGGDFVNVFLVVPTAVAGATPSKSQPTESVVRLLLTNVQVLDVSAVATPLGSQQAAATTPTTAAVQERATTTTPLTLLLAVDAIDAEKVIFGSQIDASYLYVAKVGDKAPPSAATGGQTYGSIFQEPPDQAFARQSTAN
jgi:Flp pilus assembly protein CpaB